MEKMTSITYRGQKLTVTAAQSDKLLERVNGEAVGTVRDTLRHHVSDAAQDLASGSVAIARASALTVAATTVAASDALAFSARAVATQCNNVSARMAGWILKR